MADWVPTSIAARKPFSRDGGTLWTRDIICIHTMVGSLPGSWSWASSKGTVWHFGTSGTGECWQCLPLDRRSGANLHGNHRVVAIENADMGPGFGSWNGQCGHVPPFTTAQLNKLVQLVAWLCVSLNIPPTLIPDTRPGRRGIAYHRQGIDPYRCGSCEMWSRATGKCCPDNARINQIVNEIIPRVQAAISGGVPAPVGAFMALTDQEQAYLYERMIRVEKALAKALGAGKEYLGYKDGIESAVKELPDLPQIGLGVIAGVDNALSNDRPSGSAARQGVRSVAGLGAADTLGERVSVIEAKLDAILAKLETGV